MTITAIMPLQTPPILPLHREESNSEKIKKVATIASIVTGIWLGCSFIPKFAYGLGIGCAAFIAKIVIPRFFKKEKEKQEEKKPQEQTDPYTRYLRDNLLSVALFGPIDEEMQFRALLLPAIEKVTLLAIPKFAAPLCGLGMSIAVGFAIATSSIFFGAVHLQNPHKGAKSQAIKATYGGVVKGLIFHYMGIGAACAAHIANNTIVALSLMSGFKPDLVPNKDRRLFPDFFNERKTTLLSKP